MMNYRDEELKDIYEKKLYFERPELIEYQDILSCVFTLVSLFSKREENRMGNFKMSYSFMRELFSILTRIDKHDLKLINVDFLRCICFEEYTSSMPCLKEFKSVIVPYDMIKEDVIGYILSIERIFGANSLIFESPSYHNFEYNDFSVLLEYYKYSGDNPLIQYLCFYFYANKAKYNHDIMILSDMIFKYLEHQLEYDEFITLLLGEDVWNYNYFYKAHNVEKLYNILERIIVPQLLDRNKQIRKF